jgi:hypothetical protein
VRFGGGAEITLYASSNDAIKRWTSYWQMKWQIFVYNYGWSRYVFLFDGWIARSAMAVPIVGYLILFNDSISQHLSFKILAGESTSWFGLSSSARLKLIYFGLIFLGIATILYRLRRPYVFRIGTNQFDYVERALRHFTASAYIDTHGAIRHEGHHTLHGKYYDSEYEAFLNLALGKVDEHGHRREATANWNEAKSKYEGLLRSMLIENFSRNEVTRRFSLSFSIIWALAGYTFLLIPSIDLFLRVLAVSL